MTAGRSPATGSLPAAYFEAMYSSAADPWAFEHRWYELRKRALTLAVLPRRRFSSAFEPGCSIGLLTAELANRCDALLAVDVAEAAVRATRERVAQHPHVRVRRAAVPADWPTAEFDLIVISEVGYYCAGDDLVALVDRATTSLTDDGVLVLCHWRHPVADYPTTGDAVHRAFARQPALKRLGGYADDDLLLDVLVHPSGQSVAREEGLVD